MYNSKKDYASDESDIMNYYHEEDYPPDDYVSTNQNNIFVKRIDCWEDTVKLCQSFENTIKSEKVVFTDKKLIPTINKSKIYLFNQDTIDCAINWKLSKWNPLVLNLSDDIFAGGWVSSGSGAQEESLFRRTDYYKTLLQSFYPILNNEAIYSPKVSVLKTSEKTDWKILKKHEIVTLSFIACPAIKYPDTVRIDDERLLNDSDVQILKKKIALIIQTAAIHNHDTIIFGAMGCGAWKNPIRHVAKVFKEVLKEYDGLVLNYVFSIMTTTDDNYIIRDHDQDKHSSFDIFSQVLNDVLL